MMVMIWKRKKLWLIPYPIREWIVKIFRQQQNRHYQQQQQQQQERLIKEQEEL